MTKSNLVTNWHEVLFLLKIFFSIFKIFFKKHVRFPLQLPVEVEGKNEANISIHSLNLYIDNRMSCYDGLTGLPADYCRLLQAKIFLIEMSEANNETTERFATSLE
jgi:hypothetical protein